MAEPLPETSSPQSTHGPVEPTPELARKNLQWGWALFGLFCLLFAGTVGVAFVYLWLS
jgi:hypothetical protein